VTDGWQGEIKHIQSGLQYARRRRAHSRQPFSLFEGT